VEWIPKNAVSESFRLSTRTIPEIEMDKAISIENRNIFFDAEQRELACKNTKTR
jgi:hypothetical protein